MRLEAEGDVLADREMREQRIALEHDADVAPVRGQLRHVLPAHHDAARIAMRETRDDAQQRGLAAARWPQQRHEFAGTDGEVETIHDGLRAVALDDAGELQSAHGISRFQ